MFQERIGTGRMVAKRGAKPLVDPATTCKPSVMRKTQQRRTPTEVHVVFDDASSGPVSELSPAEERFIDFLIDGALTEYLERARDRPDVPTNTAPDGRRLDEHAGLPRPRRRGRSRPAR